MPTLDCNYSSPPRPGGVNLNGNYAMMGTVITWKTGDVVLGVLMTGINGNFDMYATLTPGFTYTFTVTAEQNGVVVATDTQQWTVPE